MQNKKPVHYRVKQVAEIFEVHPNTIYRWIRNGTLRAVLIGGEHRISENEIQRQFEGAQGGDNVPEKDTP